MDHLICVVDETTLVENIQEIKSLVQQGLVRLVVPQCTSTSLEQKHAKLQEEANKRFLKQEDSQRPRSGGRPTRTERPAFDINPLVACEFLKRSQSKNGQGVVEFQKDSEQYSPWKILELEEESKSANENRPTTFAQAVQKQNIERLLNSAEAGNGPMKPRLVARSAGSDGSPWKKSNKALSLPISEVPKQTRPVLGCLLWRLHEKGATRWDTDRTTLLCDHEQTTNLGKKLGVPARSMAEVRQYCSARKPADTRETFGHAEEYFGIQEKARVAASDKLVEKPHATTDAHVEIQPVEDKMDEMHSSGEVKDAPPSSASAKNTGSIASVRSSDSEKKSIEIEKSDAQTASNVTANSNLSKEKLDVTLDTVLEDMENRKIPGLLVTNMITENKASVAAPTEQSQSSAQPAHPLFKTLDLEKEHSIAAWVRGLTNNGELSGRKSPVSGHSSNVEAPPPEPEVIDDFKPLTYRQAVTGKADEVVKKQTPPPPRETLPSPRVSPVRDFSPPKMVDPVDSDDEIVVFNPKAKRLSAQKAQQAQQAQRPQTPTASPRVSHTRNASGGRPHSRGTNQRQPRPGPPPVVIDPDSFGRNLVINPQTTAPRTFSPYGAHGRVTNHPRGGHRPHNPRPVVQSTPPRANGATLANGTADGKPQPSAKRIPAATEQANVETTPGVQAPAATVITPPSLLKPNSMVNGSSTCVPPSAPSGPALAVNGSAHVGIRPERPRYSPRGTPRHTPSTSEAEVPFILRSGQPREATKGRGKLWVP
ncbi:MAG: hypothetical protein Q9166_006129 [cf. Caloplaca sp. 2 TL-2023]